MSETSNAFERAEFISAGGKEHVCISNLPSTILADGWVRPQRGEGVRVYFIVLLS